MKLAAALMAFASALAWAVKASLTGGARPAIAELTLSIEKLEARLSDQADLNEARFQRIESRLDEHECRLNHLPTTAQILSSLQELFTSLDERLVANDRQVQELEQVVRRTDSLIAQVLESITALTGERKQS